MLTQETKRHIDAARQVLVGVVPNPTSQIDQITNALIYKFMDDMDQAAIKAGGKPSFFVKDLERYAWTRLMDTRIGNQERMNLYSEALVKFSEAKQLPELFRGIFKSAFLPYRSSEVLGLFLKEMDYFDYSHSEELGNAYEYLLSIMGSQGDAGQFRTPRHIIDFIVAAVNPTKDDKVLDPACGTAGFLISAYKHILEQHDGKNPDGSKNDEKPLTPDQRKALMNNFEGYDVDPGMVRISQVNLYLHNFRNPKIYNYNTLSQEERWADKFDVILANPPFMSPKGGVSTHNKFSVPSSRSEVLFVDYIMNHLRPKGRAGIIVPEGIIFQSGKAHKQLRKNLVEDGLYAVVSLPSGVFQPYSGVKTSILLFDNELSKQCSEILFIDIKDVGVSLGAARREIDKNDLEPALEIIEKFRKGQKIISSRLAFVAQKTELIVSGYDLSPSKYRKLVVVNTEKPFVALAEVCAVIKGKSSSTKTEPGNYRLYLTAEGLKTADHFDFDGEGVCVPLISATGHGKAAIKRVHYVKGRFALANLLAFVQPTNIHKVLPKYLYYCLDRRERCDGQE
jgi:Type I restriction-modification system methyltransferase subunit